MNAIPPNHPDDPGASNAVMEAFAGRVEDDAAIIPPGQNLPVMIRPVGAQAIAIRRDPGKVLRELRTLASAAGGDWFYRWEVTTKDKKKAVVEGPSVKLANDLARTYGNCAVTMDRVDDIGTHWVFYPRFIDFETGYEYQRPFQQRKGQKAGERMDSARGEDIAFQIGASKALRNTIVNALGTFADFALAEAKTALVNRIARDVPGYLQKTLARLHDLDIALPRVERAIGKPHAAWDAPILARVIAEIQAINEGMATADELYPLPPVDPVQKLKQFGEMRPGAQGSSQTEPAATTAHKAQPGPSATSAARPGREIPDHDPQTGEVRDDVPAFLDRRPFPGDQPANDPHAGERAALRRRFPNVPPDFIDGYMGAVHGDTVPEAIAGNPKRLRNYQVGAQAAEADIEEGKNRGES